MKNALTFGVFAICALAFSTNYSSLRAEDPACVDKKPSQTSSTKFGAAITCDGNSCPQNYSQDYTYKCEFPSPGNQCIAASVIISKVVTYGCEVPDGGTDVLCVKHEDQVMGTGLESKACKLNSDTPE